ncbi:Cof-type HAD-IIB family hydrolase [Desulfosporosinus fructosivorans]
MQKTNKAAIKLIVFDLDDTLLNSNSSISPRTYQAIQQVVAKGIKVTLATGRMYSSAIPFARSLGLGIPVISYNGAQISSYPSGERLFHNPIKQEVARQVMQLCRERQWYIQTYINDVLYVKEIDKRAELYARITGAKPIPVGDRLYTMLGAPTKMLAIAEPGEIELLKEGFHTQLGNVLCIAESKPNFLEINDLAVNKGAALRFVASRLNINRQEIMTFGNGINDIEMLSYSGWGVAVSNAPSAVKNIARLVTGSNDEEGVADVIEKYVLS